MMPTETGPGFARRFTLCLKVLAFLAAMPAWLLAAEAAGAQQPDPLQLEFTELAPGVWLGSRPDSTRLPVTPNSTFVISDAGVVVFDGGNLPLVADRVIEKIRELTDQPVTHVIASHWHMDHVLGLARYREAWPRTQLVSRPYTRELMARYLAKNGQNMRNTVPDNAPGIQSMLDATPPADGRGPEAATIAWLRDFVANAELLDQQYQNFVVSYPNLTVDKQLTIHSGGREIIILHPGTGNTPGDLVLWLPEEKILASGDIVVWPTPYGHGGHPAEWAQTLERINAMDWKILVPGHGDVLHDRAYPELMADTLRSISKQMSGLVAQGIGEEEAARRLDLKVFQNQFTRGDAFLDARFREWFADPIATAAWRIASGQDPEIVGSE
jgi:glyoxylase-like metal-dependent hydrolase (beta-lactamase superfamily II)